MRAPKIAVALVIILAPWWLPPHAEAKPKTPSGCLTVMAEADALLGISGEFSGRIGDFFGAVSASATAHSSGTTPDTIAFLNEMTDEIKSLGDDTVGFTARIKEHGIAYRSAKVKCRAGR